MSWLRGARIEDNSFYQDHHRFFIIYAGSLTPIMKEQKSFDFMQPPNWRPRRMAAKNYNASCECIYCGTTGNKKSRLSDEHIIALGLDGRLIFPQSSCPTCATITGKLEQGCLRGPFLIARTQMNLRSRRPRQRPRSFPLRLNLAHLVLNARMRVADYPAILVMPMFREPDVLSGAPSRAEFGAERRVGANEICPDYNERRRRLAGLPHAQPVGFQVLPFGRMLAKIAHAYAVAEIGGHNFSHTLPLIVLGTDLTDVGRYVGGSIN
jgi:hypothetical protein